MSDVPAREELLRLLLGQARDHALLLLDPDGRVVAWLAGAEDVFGYTAKEMTGRRSADLFTPEDREQGLAEHELAVARHEGLVTALVLMPEGPAMRGWYRPAGWRDLRAYLDRLGRRFGVQLIDARAWVGEEDFTDSHHLAAAGARRFSARLGRDVLLHLLLQTSQRRNASVSDLTGSRRGRNSWPR